jgi:hypothetical protein
VPGEDEAQHELQRAQRLALAANQPAEVFPFQVEQDGAAAVGFIRLTPGRGDSAGDVHVRQDLLERLLGQGQFSLGWAGWGEGRFISHELAPGLLAFGAGLFLFARRPLRFIGGRGQKVE